MAYNGAFQSILFPVDFSEASASTALHVRGVAERTGARVTLLHVIPWLSAWYGETELRAAVPGDDALRNLADQSATALKMFRAKYFSDIPSSSQVTTGAVAETITETAAESGVDLIMMSTRGLGKSRPFLIGSTTAKVLHDATCAVWTSPHIKPHNCFGKYEHILCSVDREDIPHGYIEEAIRLAACFQSKLTFLTAVPSCVGGCGDEHHIDSLAREFPRVHLEQLKRVPDCNVLFETGPVGDVIRKAVETHAVDLVLTNRGHIKHPFGRFRTHIYEIVLESPCPVLSLCIHLEKRDEAHPQNAATVKRYEATLA